MEEWRALAQTAPGTCLAVALETSGAGGLLVTVDRAHRMLGAIARTLRTLPPAAAAAAMPADDGGALPCALLEGAHRELARLDALHAGAGYVCDLYAPHAMAHHPGGAPPPYMSWRRHVRDAVLGAGDAKERLRCAAAEARAAEAALRVSRSFPGGSHGWASWRAAARRLALHAVTSAAMAFYALWRMHDALVLECVDAWRILNPSADC